MTVADSEKCDDTQDGARLPVSAEISRKLEARKSYVQERTVGTATGSWLRNMFLLVTGTAQPTLLGLPYGIAQLGWAGGVILLVASGVVNTYANILLAALQDYGGKRNTTYRELACTVLARHRWAKSTVMGLQVADVGEFAVIVGVGICNLILAATCLQSIYLLYCGDSCPIGAFKWTWVAGGALVLVAQCPDLARFGGITSVTTFFLIFYSLASVILAGVQGPAGNGGAVSYAIEGNTINRVMNGLNAIGIVAFCFANIIVPELMAIQEPEPGTRNTFRPMRKAIVAAYMIIGLSYLLVSVIGYWAFGNQVSGFLLAQFNHPTWLIIVTNLMCFIHLLVGEQIFEYVLYEPWELWVVRRFPRATWLSRPWTDPMGTTISVPSRWTQLLVRVPYIAVITAIAAIFPFFSEVMGFIGAVALTPLCLVLPMVLYVVARGRAKLGALSYWFNVGVATLFAAVGLLATVGAVRSIVVAIQQHDFFS